MFCSSLASTHAAPRGSLCAEVLVALQAECEMNYWPGLLGTSQTRPSHNSSLAGAVCLTPAHCRRGGWVTGTWLQGNEHQDHQPGPNRDALRFGKPKVIPSLSCSGEDGLSVVHVSFAKGLTGVKGRSRWLSVTLQASVRAKTKTWFLKSRAPSPMAYCFSKHV